MKKLILLVTLALPFILKAETVICTTKKLSSFDPQQISSPLDNYLRGLLYLPFFPEGNVPGVARSWEQKGAEIWKITLNDNIRFQDFEKWKAEGNLSARDVEYSLNRQLLINASTHLDEQTFLPAKLSGLEKYLKEVKSTGTHEVELHFNNHVSFEELKKMLQGASGTILPKSFATFKSHGLIRFWPATGRMKISSIENGRLRLIPSIPGDKNDPVIIQELSSSNLHFSSIVQSKCRRLYYPPDNLLAAATDKKIPAKKLKVSHSLMYFMRNKYFPSVSEVQFRAGLHPDRFPSLSSREKSNRIFTRSKLGSPSQPSGMKAEFQEGSVVTCDYPYLTPQRLKNIQTDFTAGLREAAHLKVAFTPVGCLQLPGYEASVDTIGILGSFEYISERELLAAFECGKVSRNIFGFCLEKPEKEKIESEILTAGLMIPLARFENYVLEFYEIKN